MEILQPQRYEHHNGEKRPNVYVLLLVAGGIHHGYIDCSNEDIQEYTQGSKPFQDGDEDNQPQY
jgi:hypothetical protein